MNENRERGIQIFEEVYGKKQADGLRAYIENSDEFGVEHAKWSMDFAFGTVWARDGLERKMRSLAVLGMMIGLRQYDEIKYHTKMGTANGLTKTEIEEVLYSTIPYCGLPAANVAKAAMLDAFKELEATSAE
jgi:4-carboxymuconolactone decarboxylase